MILTTEDVLNYGKEYINSFKGKMSEDLKQDIYLHLLTLVGQDYFNIEIPCLKMISVAFSKHGICFGESSFKDDVIETFIKKAAIDRKLTEVENKIDILMISQDIYDFLNRVLTDEEYIVLSQLYQFDERYSSLPVRELSYKRQREIEETALNKIRKSVENSSPELLNIFKSILNN